MKILFKGLTNKPYCMLMSGIFTFPDGRSLAIASDAELFYSYDAEPEEFDIAEERVNHPFEELYRFELTWELCYRYNDDETDEENFGDIIRYFTRRDVPYIREAEMTEICVHEDACPGYFIMFDEFSVY